MAAPDLESAGMGAPEPDQSSLLTRLRSLPASPMGQAGSILSGFAAGAQGQPNPVLAQQQQAQRDQFAISQVMLQVQRERRLENESQRGLALDLLRTNNEAAMGMGARLLGEQLKRAGVQVPPGFDKSLATPTVGLEKRKQAYLSILSGASDDYLEHGLLIPKDQIPALKQEAQSRAVYKMLYGTTPEKEERETAKADLDQKKYEIIVRRQDLADSRQALSEAKEQRQALEAQQRIKIAEGHLAAAEARNALAERKFEWMQAHGPEEKRLKGLDQADLLANQMEATGRKLAETGYIPPPGVGVLSMEYLGAQAKRRAFPNDPHWRLWSNHLQPAMVGYARSVQNDIGPRAMQAFSGAMKLMENPPDIDSIMKVVENMRIAIKLGREGKDTANFLLIKRPDGQVLRVRWKRGMEYAPGDEIVAIE